MQRKNLYIIEVRRLCSMLAHESDHGSSDTVTGLLCVSVLCLGSTSYVAESWGRRVRSA